MNVPGKPPAGCWKAPTCQSQQIDLLFTDIVMPEGISGLELSETLRAQKPALRIVLSSGYSAELFQIRRHPETGRGVPCQPLPNSRPCLCGSLELGPDGDAAKLNYTLQPRSTVLDLVSLD